MCILNYHNYLVSINFLFKFSNSFRDLSFANIFICLMAELLSFTSLSFCGMPSLISSALVFSKLCCVLDWWC